MSTANVADIGAGVVVLRPQQNDTALRKEQLQKQLQQIKENETLPQDEKERRMEKVEKQIAQLEKSNQNSEKTPPAAPEKATDRFERQVLQQSAGVYKISRDDMGRPVVQTDESRQGKPDRVKEKPDEQGDKPTIVKTTLNTDQVDREIDKLKQTQTKMKQQIAATKDEKEKQAL